MIRDESDGENLAIILDRGGEVYKSQGIHLSNLFHLDSIGLINLEQGRGVAIPLQDKKAKFTYFDKTINISHNDNSEDKRINLSIGFAIFTKIGQELSKISQPIENEEFLDYVIRHWTNMIVDISNENSSQ